MARTHVLENREELVRYLRGAFLAFTTAVSEDVGKKLKLTQEQVEVIDKVFDDTIPGLGDNIKFAMGEYHALMEEGKVKEEEQYRPTPGTDLDKHRKEIMEQVEDIEKYFGLEDDNGSED